MTTTQCVDTAEQALARMLLTSILNGTADDFSGYVNRSEKEYNLEERTNGVVDTTEMAWSSTDNRLYALVDGEASGTVGVSTCTTATDGDPTWTYRTLNEILPLADAEKTQIADWLATP